jgi:hypothetical protein
MTQTTTPAASPLKIRLDNVRIAFPRLYKGEQYQGAGTFRCGAQLIISPDHPQMAKVEALIDLAGQTKFKDKWPVARKAAFAKDNVCLRDGDLKAKYEGFAGNKVLSANCPGGETEEACKKPKVYDLQRNLVEKDNGMIYSGCFVNALVEFYGDGRRGEQINCSLLGVQFARDGYAFAGSSAKADDFEAASEGADAGEFV